MYLILIVILIIVIAHGADTEVSRIKKLEDEVKRLKVKDDRIKELEDRIEKLRSTLDGIRHLQITAPREHYHRIMCENMKQKAKKALAEDGKSK